jgi:LPXTG-motif cell wall-anchored protein
VSPQINALATLLIAAVAVFVGSAGWLLGRRRRAGPRSPHV